MAYIGKNPTTGSFTYADDITTSATNTYNILVGGVAFSPESANHCIVSLNGVIQKANTSFSISGSQITFLPSSGTLSSSDSIDFILILGSVNDVGVATTVTDSAITKGKLNLISDSSSAGLTVKGDGSSENGTIALNCSSNSHAVKLSSPSHASGQSYEMILPATNITAGKFLKVDSVSGSGATGIGQLSFADAGGNAGEYAFRVTKSSAQSISSGTSTVITFDTETFDIGSGFASNKFTVPSGKDGVYFFHFEVITNENIGGDKFQASIRVNGSGVSFSANSGGSGSYRAGITTSALANLSAGDYVDCDVFQQHGTVTVSGGSFCTFQGFRLT